MLTSKISVKESDPKGKMTLAVSSAEGGRGVRPSGVGAAENDTATESCQLSLAVSSWGGGTAGPTLPRVAASYRKLP